MNDMRGATEHKAGYAKDPQSALTIALGERGSWIGYFATADATVTPFTISKPDKKQVQTLRVLVSAAKSDGSAGASWVLTAAVRCNSAGVLSLIGAVSPLATEADAALAAATADIVVSGGNVNLSVAGVAATAINWTVNVEVG